MSFLNTILREAMQLFEQNGIDQFSEAELQRRLDISEATFSGFFKDKEDLLIQAYQQRLSDDAEAHEKISARAANPIEEILGLIEFGSKNLKTVSPVYIRDIMNQKKVLEVAAQHMENYSYPQIYRILNKGVELGYFRKEINLTIVSRVILENVYMLLNTRVFPPESFSTREVFRNIYLYYIRGLCTREHIDLTDKHFS